MRHDRLKPIPGQVDPRDRDKDSELNAIMMADEALRALPFRRVAEVIEGHLNSRDDIAPLILGPLADRLGRLAHMKARD